MLRSSNPDGQPDNLGLFSFPRWHLTVVGMINPNLAYGKRSEVNPIDVCDSQLLGLLTFWGRTRLGSTSRAQTAMQRKKGRRLGFPY